MYLPSTINVIVSGSNGNNIVTKTLNPEPTLVSIQETTSTIVNINIEESDNDIIMGNVILPSPVNVNVEESEFNVQVNPLDKTESFTVVFGDIAQYASTAGSSNTANTATTASFAVVAQTVIDPAVSASYALSSSFAGHSQTSVSASFVPNTITQTALTAEVVARTNADQVITTTLNSHTGSIASVSTLGHVKVDGNSIKITNGVISSPLSYRHIQQFASSEWIVIHNLGRRPVVRVTDSAGTMVQGDLRDLDDNSLQLSFSAAFSGEAYLT